MVPGMSITPAVTLRLEPLASSENSTRPATTKALSNRRVRLITATATSATAAEGCSSMMITLGGGSMVSVAPAWTSSPVTSIA